MIKILQQLASDMDCLSFASIQTADFYSVVMLSAFLSFVSSKGQCLHFCPTNNFRSLWPASQDSSNRKLNGKAL